MIKNKFASYHFHVSVIQLQVIYIDKCTVINEIIRNASIENHYAVGYVKEQDFLTRLQIE